MTENAPAIRPRITPVGDIRRRLPELGRIRAGYSTERDNGKKQPHKSETWIVTTNGRPEILEALAVVYGGAVEEWDDNRTNDTHRLVTESDRLQVVLPPNPFNKQDPNDPNEPVTRYEKWESGDCRRRCDGTTCTGYPKDGSPPVDVPCLCQDVDDQSKHCKPKTYLSLMLPQSPIGVFRLATTSRNAMAELAMAVEVIQLASSVGLPTATLLLEDRKRPGKIVDGVRQPGKRFKVPVLTTNATLAEVQAAATAPQVTAGGAPGLPAAPMQLPPGAVVANDPGVIDAESWEG